MNWNKAVTTSAKINEESIPSTRALRKMLLCIVLSIILQAVNAYADDNPEFDVVVIGAGISGLTAAYFLRDYDIKVLEKEGWVGGRTIMETHRSFHYAKGTEYLGEPYDALKIMIDELDLEPVEIQSPMDAHYYNGTFWYGYDGITRLLIENSDLATFNRFGKTISELSEKYVEIPEFDIHSDLAELDHISAAAWFDREGFPEIYKEIYNVTSKGLFGANIDEISALSYLPEIAFDFEDFEEIDDADELSPNTFYAAQEESSEAYTFITGITEVTNGIALELGDRVQLYSTVTSVQRRGSNNGYTIYYTDKNGNKRTVSAAVVISAVPAPIAVMIGADVLSDRQKELLGQIPFSSYATVALFSDEVIWNKAFDLAVPDNYFFTDVYDSTWVERFYTPGKRYIEEYIAGVYISEQSYKETRLLRWTDDEILERVLRDLEKIVPDVRDRVNGYDVYRHVYAYPIMTLGMYERLTELHDLTQGPFFLAGDFMVYPTFESAVDAGFLAAENAMEWLD